MPFIKPMLLTLFYFCFFNVNAQNYADTLNRKIEGLFQESKFPGFSVAIVNETDILYQESFGFANIKEQKPFTKHTILNIGSVSKTFIAVAITQLMEAGKIKLDDPINQHLNFKVIHPQFPDQQILVRHLVSHTSGISDSKMYSKHAYVFVDREDQDLANFSKDYKKFMQSYKTKPPALHSFLEDYLVKGGKRFKKKNWNTHPVGSHYEYSNIGSALAALMVEHITGLSFADYTQKHVLDPLNLKASGWTFEDIDYEAHAMLYLDHNKPLPKYTLVTYPDGGLLANANDLSIYLRAMIQGKKGNSSFMTAESFEKMFTVLHEQERERVGIFWDISPTGKIGHTGGDPGIFTYIRYLPESNIGLVFVSNILIEEKSLNISFAKIWKTMRHYGAKF